jgi:hypothetical protein
MEHPNFVKVCLLINKETFHVFIPTGVYKDGNTLVMKNNEIAVLNYQREIMFKQNYILPKSELGKFINAYKSASSRLLKKEYPQIRERLWKEAFWSQSFCLLTAGGAPIDVIRSYIETQGEKKR